ncbi:hypothetical protein GCM10008916_08070 [Clostridium nitritogenes]|uniref:Uncharacterized protein n=1 Tax=Clostridium nitritogenes TaxID=83340 RepID=A0ABP3WUS3_9CLOT
MIDILVSGLMGIFGTVIGVLLSEFIRRKGKVKILVNSFKIEFYKTVEDILGGFEELEDKENPGAVRYSYEVDIFNLKEIHQNFNRVITLFQCENGEIIESSPYNANKYKVIAGKREYEKIKVLNIKPKEYISLKLEDSIYDRNKIEKIKKYKKVYLSLSNIESNKEKRILIKENNC